MTDSAAAQGERGSLTVISGPAGSGKTTLCDRLLLEFPDVARVVTTTTREPREGEREGEHYHFLSVPEFEARIAKDAFYEWAKVHGRYYGSERHYILEGLAAGRDLLLNIDVQGAESYRRAAARDPYLARRLITVFIEPCNLEQIRERLLGRGTDSNGEIERRLETARQELAEAPKFHHRIRSGSRESDYTAFRNIFEAHRQAVRADHFLEGRAPSRPELNG